MADRYDIARDEKGWAVLENGVAVEVQPDRALAEAIAELLIAVSRPLGRPAPPWPPEARVN